MAEDKNKQSSPIATAPLPQLTPLGLSLAGFDTEPTQAGAILKESQYTPRVFPQELSTLEDRRALLQPWTDKLGNGLINAGSNAFTSASNNSVGLVYGAFESVANMDASKMWNNELTEATTAFSEAVREENPFYYSEAEKNASLLASIGKGNFWFDKVLGGTGYIVGSLLTGYGAARLFQLGKTAQLAKLEQATLQAGELGATAEGLTGAASSMARKNLVKEFGLGLSMANGESVVESLETAKQLEDYLIEARGKGRNGDPEFAQYANMTDDEIQKAKIDAGNTNWLAGLFITGGGSLLLLKNFINPGKKAAIREYNNIGKRTLQNGAEEYFDRVAAKKEGAFLTIGKKAGEGFIEEAAQEGGQFASNIAAKEFVKKYNVEGQEWFNSVLEGLAQGIEETVTSKEGLESMLVGGISGAPFGAKGATFEKLAREQNTKRLVDSLNLDPRFSKAAPKVQSFLGALKRTQNAEESLKQGDIFNAKNEADLGFNEYVKSQIDTGAFNYFITRLQGLKQGPVEELQEFFGEGTTPADVDQVINKATALNELNNSINILYSTAGGTPEQKAVNEQLRNKLFFSAATIKDYEQREQAIGKELQDMQNPAINTLLSLRNQALNIDKAVVPEGIAEKEVEKYIEESKKNLTETYNKAVDSFIKQDPVNGVKVAELLADLNSIDTRKKDFIEYYNALNDPEYTQKLFESEQKLAEDDAKQAEAKKSLEQLAETLEKESNLPEELINDVFKKDVNATNVVTDLNGNQIDLAQSTDAELRGLRSDVESNIAVLGETADNIALRDAIEKELDERDGVVTATSLKDELSTARTPEQVQAIVDKAAANNFVVDPVKVEAVHKELIRRKREREATDRSTKDIVSKFKDVREFINSFTVDDETQKKLDDILTNDPEALNKITLKVSKNPNPPTVTKLEDAEYFAGSSPLEMAIQYEGQDIAYIPYFGQFVNEQGVVIDPTLMSYAEWLELFKPSKAEKGTEENFQRYQQAFKASQRLFIYLNENLAKGKTEYSNEEVKQILSPNTNPGYFDIVGASPETSLGTGNYNLYQDEAGDFIIVDTRSDNSNNYTSVNNAHIDPTTLAIDDRYKEAFTALGERKAAGKINKKNLKQRYVALVATPLGTISMPGDNRKFEWMPVTPARFDLGLLLSTLREYQANKTESEAIGKELNSLVFFSLESDWDIGLFMNPERTDFIVKMQFKGLDPAYIRIPIKDSTTPAEFLKALNESIQKSTHKIGDTSLEKVLGSILGDKGITEENFRAQIPSSLPELQSQDALDTFYSILSPNIKRETSFNFRFNAPAVQATQPIPAAPAQPIASSPNTLLTALQALKNKILSSANPKIKLSESVEALVKYGFTPLQVKFLRASIPNLYITTVEALDRLIETAEGKKQELAVDTISFTKVLEKFTGREQAFLDAVQGVASTPAPAVTPTVTPTQPAAAPVFDIKVKNTISNGDKIISVQTKPITDEIKDTAEDLFILPDKNPEGRIHINMEPLKDILVVPNNTFTIIDKKTGKEIVSKELNPEGAVIFEAMQGRLFVVANINGQLIPFYKSSAGTSGKTQGAWYPFFGYTGAWLVKGSIDKATGKMSYSPEIDRVTDLLNENLVFPDKYIDRTSNSIKNTKGEVIIDMNQAFKVNRLWQKEFGSQTGIGTNYQIKGLKENTRSESGLVALITGLNTTELDSSKTPKENSEWFNLISKNAELDALEGAAPTTAKKVNPRNTNSKGYNPTADRADSSGERIEKRRNLTAAFAYIKSIFGNSIGATELDALEENLANNKVRYGTFKDFVIKLSRFSPVGTEFHEAFHAVFRAFLNDAEITYYRNLGRESLYQVLKAQNKSINQAFQEFKKDFILKNPDKKVSDADLRNLMIEEHLADRFRDWKLKKQSAKSGLAKFFNDLWEKLARLINITVESKEADEIDALFAQIDSGKFKNAPRVANQYTNTIIPADISLYAGTRNEVDEATGQERVYPVYLPEHVANQLVGTVISKVYTSRKENPKLSYDTLIEQALDNLHSEFELDSRYDVLENSTNEKAKDLLYSIEYALDKNSWANKAEDEQTGATVVPSYSPRKAISDSVKSALRSFNFNIDKVLEEEEKAEEKVSTGSTSNNEESGERNRDMNQENLGGWNNLSKKLRAYISLTTYSVNLNDFFGVEGIFDKDQNITLAVDIKRVYNGLAKATQNSLTPKEIMTKLVHYRNVAGEARPVIDKLLQDINFPIESFLATGEYSEKALNQENIDIYYAFVKGFNLHAFDHSFTEHDFESGLARTYSSNRKASDQVQLSAWRNDFTKKRATWGATPAAIQAHAKNTIVPILQKAKLAVSVDSLSKAKEPQAMTEKVIATRMTAVREGLESVGIKVSEGYIRYIVLANPAYTSITPEQKSYVESFSYNTKESPQYLIATFDALIDHINLDRNPFTREILKKTEEAKQKVEGEAVSKVKEKTIEVGLVTRLLTMAKNNEVFDETVAPNTYLNAENKPIYGLQKPTADSIITLCIARDRQDLLPLNYQTNPFFKDHYLLNNDNFKKIKQHLKILREDGARVRNLKWTGTKYEIDTTVQTEKGVTFGSYKARELAISEYSHYLDSRYDSLIGRGEMKVRPLALDVMENASSLNLIPLPIVDAYNKVDPETGAYGITDTFKQAILIEVKREWDRIQRVKAEGNNPTVSKEGFNSGATDDNRATLRGYNFWHWDSLLKFKDSTLKDDLLNTDNFEQYEQEILKQIGEYFNDQITQHLNQLATLGVVRKKKDGDRTFYVNVLLDTRYGRRDVRNSKSEWVSEKADERKKKLQNMQGVQMPNPFASEYLVNNVAQVFLSNYLNRLSYNQLIKGDAAEVVKNPIDWFKRAKGRNASGDSLYSEDMPETRFGIIGKRDPVTSKMGDPSKMFTVTNRLLDMNNSEDAKEFEEVLASIQNDSTLTDKEKEKKLADIRKKGKVDIADAQGWISAETYMNYLHGLGKLSKQTREIYQKIIAGEEIKPKDLKTLKEEGVMGNSLKVVYYDGVRFFKLSVQLLSRQETSVKVNGEWVARPGKEIKHNMLDQMEQHNINLLIPPSASKMLTENVIELNADDTFTISDPEKQIGKISNLFGRLQQENPSNKDKITLPTQMETVVEAEQDLNATIDYPFFPGVKTVGDLLKHFQDAKAQKIARSYVPVKNAVFALQNGRLVPNMGRLAKIMRDNLVRTGATGQLLEFFQVDENGIPAYDFANMPHTQGKFEQLYNAHFNNVFKQVVPGYKTTLQSAFGHQLMYYIDKNGKEVLVNQAMFEKNSEKYLADYKAGLLKTRELAYNKPRYDKNGKQIGVYSEFVMSAHFAEQYNLKPGDIIPEEIAYMFGVRIPSQDKHSAVALKLVDVLPGFTGSNAVFPHELVKLMGHDFDIDSMYIHRPAHYVKYVDDRPKFMAFGNTEDDPFEQYVRHYQSDKLVNLLVKEYLDEKLSKYETRGSDRERLETLLRDINENQALTEEDNVSKEEEFDSAGNLKEELRLLDRSLTLRAMQELGLPATKEEFQKATKEQGELNPSVLDNQTLNAKIALHTNPSIRKVTSTPATIDAVEDILNIIAKAQGLSSYEEMDKQYDVSSLSALMQALESNRAGQESIGAAVNATQIFVRLKEYGVFIGDKFLDKVPTINDFTSEGYNTYVTEEDERIMDILSTLTSSMTDNPKYGFVKKLGLTIDVLSNVANLVSLGYSLKDAIYLVNQDYVREYTTFVANKQNPLRPIGEKFVNPDKFFKGKLDQITNRLKELKANVSPDVLESFNFTSEELLSGLSKKEREVQEEIDYLVTNYKALKAYAALDPITRTYAKVGNVIKISKGTGSTFEEEESIVRSFEELGGKFVKGSNGQWRIEEGKQNKIMPNVIDIFKNHAAIKANLLVLADKRSNTGKVAITQTAPFKQVMVGVKNNLKDKLVDGDSVTNTAKKALLAFLTLRVYRIKAAGTAREMSNPAELIYKLADTQQTLKDEYDTLAQKYPELVGKSPALFSLGFNPETSNGFTGIEYNNMKGNTDFEARLTNDFENLYNQKETRPFVIKLFNYLIAKDALQFKNNSFINIMPAELFKRFSAASEEVKAILNKEATDEDYTKLFKATKANLVDEFMEMYVRDYGNNRNLMYVSKALTAENYPVTKNEDGSITFDLFKGWETLSKDDLMVALENSVDENGEGLSAEEVRNKLKGKLSEQNIQTFLENKEALNEMFIVTTKYVGEKKVSKIAFKDGFKVKGGTYVLVSAENSVPTKQGIEFVPAERSDLGLKEGTRATYRLKPNLGDLYNKVVTYGQFISEAEAITQDKLKKQVTSEVDGETSDTPSPTAAADRIIAQNKAKAQAAQPSKSIPTKKVISGVQTGVDIISLETAKNLGYETGGTAPRGFLQEGTKDPSLASKYGVQEISPEAQADYTNRTGKTDPYTARTEQNVKNSDGTVYFFFPGDTMGRDATKREATKLNKPFIENPTGAQLKEWLIKNNIQTLNVAGNRGSKLTKENEAEVRKVLEEALGKSTPTPTAPTTGFQGYKFGFEDRGKGTPQGDGKDKAMRKLADGIIAEVQDKKGKTSTNTSVEEIYDHTNSAHLHINGQFTIGVNPRTQGATIMLARNKEFAGQPLQDLSKHYIKIFHEKYGAEFVVGDMPGVDSQFIDYLQEIGAKFTVYHTDNKKYWTDKNQPENIGKPRIKISKPTTPTPTTPTTAVKPGVAELFESNPELANSVYEALGFNQMITPNDKIVFGHPGIGKTYLKESGRTDVIDFDSDYKIKINEKFNLPKGFKARNDFQKNNKQEYQKAIRELWNEAKQEVNKTGKQLFASDMILLREFANDFDKVITMSKETFINRAKQRNDYTPGLEGTEGWKNSLDIEIAKIDKSKILTTDKYLSDLFITPQQKQQALQLYSQYLDTIFPDSKVKNIVYHTNTQGRIEFGTRGEKGLFVTPTWELAKTYKPGPYGKRFQLLINSRNVLNLPELELMKGLKRSNEDTQKYSEEAYTEYVVFEPEQIHILGNKQDIEGFKKFVGKPAPIAPAPTSTSVKTYEGKIESLQPNQVFVFGSNPEGRHGLGTAQLAKNKFGAKYGQGRGLQGQSYALITKNLNPGFVEPSTGIKYDKAGERSVSPEQIIENIDELYQTAMANPTKEFLVAYRVDKNLNGYTAQEMANMFTALPIPNNVVFNKEFAALFQSLPPKVSSAITNITAAKAEEAESSLNLIDPNALPSREVMIKNLLAVYKEEGMQPLNALSLVKRMSDEELTKQWNLKCFGK